MRVLVVTNTFPTESEPGATPCINEQMEVLCNQFDVDFDLLYIDRYRKINYLKAALKIFSLNFRSNKYDIIHAHYGYSGVVARFQFRYPLVVTFHGSDLLHGRDGVIGRGIALLAKAVIVMTNEMKFISKRRDAYVIPFGVNTEIFFPYSQDLARDELNLPKGKKLILFPYNPNRRDKRFHIVRNVADQLNTEGYDVQVQVVHGKARELINRYMNACDVLLLTSNYEGSPMAVREAVVCKLPVVSVDVGDVSKVIESVEGSHIARDRIDDLVEKVKLSFNYARTDDKGNLKSMQFDTKWSAQKVYKVLCETNGRT